MQFAQSQKIEGQLEWAKSLTWREAWEVREKIVDALDQVRDEKTLMEIAGESGREHAFTALEARGLDQLQFHPQEALIRLADELPEFNLKELDSNEPLKIMEAVMILADPPEE